MRIMALDIGDKKIGVAMSDPEGVLATPLVTIIRLNDSEAIDSICKLVSKYKVGHVVVGLPYSLDGSVGTQAEKVCAFARKLSQSLQVDIRMQDERLSSAAADRLLSEAGAKKGHKKSVRDAAAAAFILQGYLDSLRSGD
jgi:putative Holliday junction resolvase